LAPVRQFGLALRPETVFAGARLSYVANRAPPTGKKGLQRSLPMDAAGAAVISGRMAVDVPKQFFLIAKNFGIWFFGVYAS
jgi:hypothetical protein